MAAASLPEGWCAPPFLNSVHRSVWFAWPPPWLRTAVLIASGTEAKPRSSSSTDLPASSGAWASALFRLSP